MTKISKRVANKELERIEKEFAEVAMAMRCIDAGKLDHKFVDAETKAAIRADLHDRLIALIEQGCELLVATGEVVRVMDPITGEIQYCGLEATKRLKLAPFSPH